MGIDITSVIVAGLAFIGTLVGSYFSQKKTTALVLYRLEQLENRVKEHNNLVSRMYKCEQSVSILENRESVSEHRIADLEKSTTK